QRAPDAVQRLLRQARDQLAGEELRLDRLHPGLDRRILAQLARESGHDVLDLAAQRMAGIVRDLAQAGAERGDDPVAVDHSEETGDVEQQSRVEADALPIALEQII